MKKIVLLADANSSHTRKWIEILLEQGNHVRIFSFYPLTDSWLNERGVSQESYFSETKLSLVKKLRYPLAYFKAKKFLQQAPYDAVNAHYATSYGLLGALLRPKKLILNFWGTDILVFPKKSFLHKKLMQWIITQAHVLCAPSKIMKNEIEQYTTKNIALIPFGIDLNQYPLKPASTALKTKTSIRLGIVKSLEPIYCIDVAIEAVDWLHKNSAYRFELHIAGSGSLSESLQAINTTGKKFYGKIKQEDVPQFLHRMDLFLNPTQFESFGVSTLEAMACGVPVIAHDAGGASEIIINNSGVLYSPNKPEVLAQKIIELVEAPQQYNQLQENGRKHVENTYSLSIMQLKMAQLFKD